MNQSRVVLGKRIRKLRRKAGLTHAKLAEKAELSPKHLGEFERGRGNPSLSSIENLARALNMSLSEMFDYQGERLSSGEIKAQVYQLIDTASDEECWLVHRIFHLIR
jgi:transcriptional regulator with XRE-family HTH domain